MFANKTNYLLELLLWQNSYDPKKKSQHNANKPRPFLPEFMKNHEKPETSKLNKDSQAMSIDDVKSWLSNPRGV